MKNWAYLLFQKQEWIWDTVVNLLEQTLWLIWLVRNFFIRDTAQWGFQPVRLLVQLIDAWVDILVFLVDGICLELFHS